MIYFPILRTKQGEIDALLSLKSETVERISPILQIPPPDKDRETNLPVAPSSEYVQKVVKTLAPVFDVGNSLLCYLDVAPANLPQELLWELLQSMSHYPTAPRPLFHLTATDRYSYQYEQLFDAPRSAILRVGVNELHLATPDQLRRRLESLSLAPENVTLLFDAGDISLPSYPLNVVAPGLGLAIQQVRAMGFDGIALSSAALSAKVELSAWQPMEFARKEEELFRLVQQAAGHALHYADYATGNVITEPGSSRPGTTKVRYTTDRSYVIARGQKTGSAEQQMAMQYQRLSRMITSSSIFCGADFSYGDNYIARAASDEDVSRGNPKKWVTVNTSHHIEFVVSRLHAM